MVTNKELLKEIKKSRKGEMTERLAVLFNELVQHNLFTSQYEDYSMYDDMKACALLDLVDKWHKIDASNIYPYKYFTHMIHISFISTLKRYEKNISIDALQTIDGDVKTADWLTAFVALMELKPSNVVLGVEETEERIDVNVNDNFVHSFWVGEDGK